MKIKSSLLTPSPKNNGALLKPTRAEARLAGAFRKSVAELNRCYQRSSRDHQRIGAILHELGQALHQYQAKDGHEL